FVVARYYAIRGVGRHLASSAVIRNFHHAIAIDRESIVASCRDVCAENWKTLRCKQLRLRKSQAKHWLSGRAEEIPGKRQQVRRPRANRHHDEISGETRHPGRSRGIPRKYPSAFPTGFLESARNDGGAVLLFKDNPFYVITPFVQP